MKKIIKLLLLTFLFIPFYVNASSTFTSSLSVSNNIKLDQEFNVSINISNLPNTGLVSGQYYLKYDNTKIKYLNYSLSQGNNADFSVNNTGDTIIILYVDNTGGANPLRSGSFANIKFKALKEGNVNISLTGDGFSTVSDSIINLSTNSSSKQFTIQKKEEPTTNVVETENNSNNNNNNSSNNNSNTTNNNSNSNTNNNTSNNNSSNNNNTNNNQEKDSNNEKNQFLKSLSIEGYDINFNKDILEYNIEVPNDVTKLNINYETYNNTAKVEIIDNELKDGENVVLIKVLENNEEKVYKINVLKKEKYKKIEFDKVNIINEINNGQKFLEIDIDLSYKYKIIEKSIIKLIKDNDVEIKFNINEKDNNIYYIILNKEILENIDNDIDLNINNKCSNNLKIEDIYILNLLNNDNWYKEIPIYYNIHNINNKEIYLYENNKKINLLEKIKISDDYLKINLTNKKEYILSKNKIKSNNNIINIILFLILILFILIIIISYKLIKTKNKNI